MRISIVVAVASNGVIGREGGLPWHLPDDLKRFKSITMGKPLIMGRATHESIGRALPGRQNIVVTRQRGYVAEGCDVVSSPGDALRAAGDADEVMVIGGGDIYAQFLRRTDRIHLTRVDTDVNGDTFFPPLDPAEWQVLEREEFPAGEGREYGFTYELLERRQDEIPAD